MIAWDILSKTDTIWHHFEAWLLIKTILNKIVVKQNYITLYCSTNLAFVKNV